MREAFEKWMSDNGKWPKAIERVNGAYVLMQTASEWEAWRAAWLECEIANASELKGLSTMRITTEDILQSPESQFGFPVEITTEADGEVRIRIEGCFTSSETIAIAKALRTMAQLAWKGRD